jgi:NADP-dependent aldehyde dehydrogenase
MTLQPLLLNGTWQPAQAPTASFQAINPSTRAPLPDAYPISSWADVETALSAAQAAVEQLRSTPPERLAAFLDAYAAGIEARAEALVEMAHAETGLPKEPRLKSTELPRTTGQLRQAATAARERSWCAATIDSALNIRSMYRALGGAVVVIGPNNFPFAFNGVSGGDFAAAIAAGNPVIAKAHPAHPGTTRLLAEAALEAIQATGVPPALVQMLYHLEPDVGIALVAHPLTAATGFTGSRAAGLKLKEAADRAGKPFYAEMSSINPVYMLPGALAERGGALATEFAASCTLGAGQFCTNPGLVILIEGAPTEAFIQQAAQEFSGRAPGTLLTALGPAHIARSLAVLQQAGAQLLTGGQEVTGGGFAFQNTLLRVSGADFLAGPQALQTEAFGAVSLLVVARDADEAVAITHHLEGNLTGSIYTDTQGADDALYARLEPVLRGKVGRLLNDKMPTGVAVSPGMNHGGPFPATGHPGFTAVGIPASLVRFAALHSYDNVRPQRLPPELQNANPTGSMWRWMDGTWTQASL